jgi:hypothetical protein
MQVEQFTKNHDVSDPSVKAEIEKYKKKRGITGDKYCSEYDPNSSADAKSWLQVEDKSKYYKVRSKKKYSRFYVGHYDAEKYLEQMDRYRSGMRKSRPNGRRWCLIPKQTFSIEIKCRDGTKVKIVRFSDLVDLLMKRKKKQH